ncbi:glycosyltransferase family 4 protein [Paenibacillus nasutitermitis]|uniref:Glycosyl transferase family 1 domain-containing protein n=1 Tax=Paenibacillus nasutitermitis TaxID=1652958 RepID=A0A916YL09_9BACL|nr:glycosyltransferase family 4 protein [Paenibacillus nasutitermitis]GGD49919.1 hypothetical protein GCM10010911_04330 [Paenibacillus nasutitermitis]
MMQSKPKMLIFSHICSQKFVTGAEKLLMFMTRELLQNYACTLVVPIEGAIAKQARALGIPVVIQDVPLVVSLYLALSHFPEDIRKKQQEPAWQELFRLINRERPDVILTNTCVHPLPAIATKAFGIPVIWAIMETIEETSYTPESAAIIERYADYVIGISETSLAPLRTPGMLPKTRRIPPSWEHSGLSPDLWQEHRISRRNQLGITNEQRLIGYISSAIFQAKGLEHFMLMAVSVAERFEHARFLIVGNPVDTVYFEKCMGHARSRNLMERFRWVRYEDRIETIYPAMDVLVIPSLSAEGFGMTALEGMVFGKPVVVYGSGGLSEIGNATGNSSYVVPTGNVDGLFRKVSGLLGDELELAAVGTRNAKMALSVFGLPAYRKLLRKFMHDISGIGPPKRRLVRGTMPTVYLLEDGVLRPFASEHSFLKAGYRFEDVHAVPGAMIAALPHGAAIGQSNKPSSIFPGSSKSASRGRGRRKRKSGIKQAAGRRKRTGSLSRRAGRRIRTRRRSAVGVARARRRR